MNLFPELFIPDSFLTKSVGISLPFWPRKRLFGLFLGSLCSLFFDEILVLSLLDSVDCNEPVSETFYSRQFFYEICGSFGLGPENACLGLFLGTLCSLFFAEMLVLWLLDLADCNESVFGNFYFGQFFDEIRGY